MSKPKEKEQISVINDINQNHVKKLKNLPEGWYESTVSEIVRIVSTNNKKLAQSNYLVEGKYPVIDQGQDFLAGYSNDDNLVVRESSPLITFGDHTRNFKFVNFDFVPGADGLKILKPTNVEPKWCYYIFQAIRLPNKGYARHFQYLRDAYIPVPPSLQQKAIVAKIEELFSHIDAGVEGLKKSQSLLKQYRQSVLKAAVTGELTKEWRFDRLSAAREGQGPELEPASKWLERILAERRQKWEEQQMESFKAKGKMPTDDKWKDKYIEPEVPKDIKPNSQPDYWGWFTVEQLNPPDRPCAYGVLQPGHDVENGTKLVRVGDIQNGHIVLSDIKEIDPVIAEKFPRTKLQGGEVLISLVGAIGRTAVVPKQLEGANTARAVGMIALLDGILPEWVEIWFRNPAKIIEMTNKSHEVARKTLNLEDVRASAVAIPDFEEQKEIVRIVDEKLTAITRLEKEIKTKLKQVEKMRQSILAAAFSGRLV